VSRNRCRPRNGTPGDGRCTNTVAIPHETSVNKSKPVAIISSALYTQSVKRSRYIEQTPMPLNPPRVLILRAHALEIFISGAAIALGLFLWVSMKDSNSGVNLLAGAALLVAGIILFFSAMKTILKY
jgi:hypothetical protein